MTDADNEAKPAKERDSADKPELLINGAAKSSFAAQTVNPVDKGDTVGPGNPAYSNPGGSIVQRRSRWYSSLAALRYVSSLSKDDEVRVRDSDRATSIFLLISAILTILSLLLPQLAPHRVPLVLVCDALVGAMLMFYVANRFGIINTLSPRQAILTWQLLKGAAFIGIFVTINFVLVIALQVSHTRDQDSQVIQLPPSTAR